MTTLPPAVPAQKSLGLTSTGWSTISRSFRITLSPSPTAPVFRTWWFSNQGQIGEYDTAIASVAKRADEVQFLKNGDFEANKNTQDEQLLTLTAQVLATRHTQPQLIVLHLMGSHPQACDRTKGEIHGFVQSKETSCYLHHDANRHAAEQSLYSATKFWRNLLDDLFSDHGLAFKRARERGTVPSARR